MRYDIYLFHLIEFNSQDFKNGKKKKIELDL